LQSLPIALKTLRKARLYSLIDRLDLFPLTSRFENQEPLFLFARGLIFSSSLIDEIRQDLPRQYAAAWGQIMTEDGLLSPETDVIVYEGNPFHEWKTDIIKFTIVPKEQVRAVIECCESFRPTKHHRQHLDSLLKFAPIVFLFAECCWSREKYLCKKRRKVFLDFGYKDAFFLYRWHYGINKDPNEADWFRFLDMIRSL
jgi:hypothetical protein